MKYLVKKTYTATRDSKYYDEGHTETWYSGKGQSFRELCDYIKDYAWTRKHFAEKYIQDDKDFEKRMQQNYWKVEYEIIEIVG